MKWMKQICIFIKEYIELFKERSNQKRAINNCNEWKFYSYYNMLSEWMELKNKNVNLCEYFDGLETKKFAIYGCGKIGKLAIDELLKSDAKISCIVDKADLESYKNIPVVKIDNIAKEVNAIIITTTYEYLDVATELSKYSDVVFISLEDMIHKLYRRS